MWTPREVASHSGFSQDACLGLSSQSPTCCYFIHWLPHSFILSFPRRGLKTCGVPSPVQGQTRLTGLPPGGSAWGWGWWWPDRNLYQQPLTAHLGVGILYILTTHYSEIIHEKTEPENI